MKLVTNAFQGKPVSLEEGPAKYHSTNEYYVLHRDEGRTNCGGFVRIVKVILCIELIILIGWLGCVSFSHYNTDRNTDCGLSAIGSKASEVDDDKVKNSRERRSVGGAEYVREMCEKNANATLGKLNTFAAQFVTGESSDPMIVQLRRNFTLQTILESHQVIVTNVLLEALFMGLTDDVGTTNSSIFSMIPNEGWQAFMEDLRQDFVNSTDSETRQRLEARGPSTEGMTSEFRAITESLYVDVRYCNMQLMESLFSVFEFDRSDGAALRAKRESEPVSQLTVDCRDAEAQLMEERRERFKVLPPEMANGAVTSMEDLVTSVESAMTSPNASVLPTEDERLHMDSGMTAWARFMSDAPPQLKREFYELVCDQILEMNMKDEKNQTLVYEGHDWGSIHKNWTDGLYSLLTSESPEAVLNVTIKFGEIFNLHYVKVERDNTSTDPETSAFGTLTYLDAEPEKPSLRRLKNILNGFVRLYFRVMNRLGSCQPAVGETPTRDRRFIKKRFVDDSIPKHAATCWNGEPEPALLAERRERLLALAVENATGKLELHEQNLLDAIETALNATSTSEIHFAERYTRPRMMLTAIEYLTSKASLELHKEGYEIIRDLFLELRRLSNNSPEWKGYNVDSVLANVTANIGFAVVPSALSIFHDFMRIGEPFNLRYVELRQRADGADPDKPVFGEFIYSGEQPEGVGILHVKHILNGLVKLYFKIQDPSVMCNSSAEPHVEWR